MFYKGQGFFNQNHFKNQEKKIPTQFESGPY